MNIKYKKLINGNAGCSMTRLQQVDMDFLLLQFSGKNYH
jgi:hypothetical protein